MLYVVRGKSNNNNRSLRVEANSAEEAEKIGWKSGLFVTEVEAVETSSAGRVMEKIGDAVARAWRYTPANAFKAWGRSVSSSQMSTLLVLAAATWLVDLHALKFL